VAEAAPTDEAGVGADYEYGESLDVHDEPEHNNGDGRRQQRDGGGLNDRPGLQDHLGLLDQRVLSLPSLTYPSGI